MPGFGVLQRKHTFFEAKTLELQFGQSQSPGRMSPPVPPPYALMPGLGVWQRKQAFLDAKTLELQLGQVQSPGRTSPPSPPPPPREE
mmetsp:Transcript_18843/g.56929  ORF Transcript_18843/g.56929 Transcript_18843/m.56929 type:complete len:87 (-) Transcript_18843:226-486(-)